MASPKTLALRELLSKLAPAAGVTYGTRVNTGKDRRLRGKARIRARKAANRD